MRTVKKKCPSRRTAKKVKALVSLPTVLEVHFVALYKPRLVEHEVQKREFIRKIADRALLEN